MLSWLPLAGVHVHDASAALSAVAVVGRCAMSVLSALEALGLYHEEGR